LFRTFLIIPPPPRSTLFPYTTLFRSLQKQLSSNEADIVLVNKNDYHYETTWLHEASAGTLHHDKVRYDVSSVIDSGKVQFVQARSEEHTSELQSRENLVCRLLLEKKK